MTTLVPKVQLKKIKIPCIYLDHFNVKGTVHINDLINLNLTAVK